MKYIAFYPLMFLMLWLCFIAWAPAQMDRQKQLMVKAIIERGNALMSRQLYKEALSEYQKSLDIDPGNTTARANIVLLHNNWGIYYFKHNQYQDAQAEWAMALQLNPNDSKAKNNMQVLKSTLARMGVDLNAETEMTEQQNIADKEKKKDEPGSAVVILSGNKSKTDSQDKNRQDTNYVDQYYSSERNGTVSGASNKPADSSRAEEKTTLPAQSQQVIEAQLARIERKVYGRTLDELPVTKRLEKLETDNFGQISTLPILQRVQKLNQLYP